jgi:transcriptional regulator of nitric oxide reductase
MGMNTQHFSRLGNALTIGLQTDLKLVGNRVNVAGAVYFVTYAMLEVPANILMKQSRPSMWSRRLLLHDNTSCTEALPLLVPITVIAWGIVCNSVQSLRVVLMVEH